MRTAGSPGNESTGWSSNFIWLGGLCLLAPAGLAAALATGLLSLPGALPAPGYLLVMLIAAPTIEEFVFRGRLQPQLTTYFAGKTAPGFKANAAAIAATSATFTALHWLANPISSSWWVCLPSLALGMLQFKTGRWQLCALLHSFFNLVWCLAIWLKVR